MTGSLYYYNTCTAYLQLPPEQSIHRLFKLAVGPLADFHLGEIALPVVKERRGKRAGPLVAQSRNEGVLAAVAHDVGRKVHAELLERGAHLRFEIVGVVGGEEDQTEGFPPGRPVDFQKAGHLLGAGLAPERVGKLVQALRRGDARPFVSPGQTGGFSKGRASPRRRACTSLPTRSGARHFRNPRQEFSSGLPARLSRRRAACSGPNRDGLTIS